MALSGGSTQVVMTTHSPYVLSSILDLKGVQRLVKSPDGQLTSFNLGTAAGEGGEFFKLRKRIPHDMELLEALFSPLVVIWEGDSEAGFYPTLMRQLADYPSEWLAGVNAGDVGVEIPSTWLKGAGYEAIVVLDGDQMSRLSDLATKGIAFLALPAGKKIEHLLTNAFRGIEDGLAAQIILSGIGYAGKINWNNDFPTIWPALAELFREKGLQQKSLLLEEALAGIAAAAAKIAKTQSPENIQKVLENNKRRRIFEAIAVQLQKSNAIPSICVKILEALKEIWLNKRSLGQYQFDASGHLTNYNP
jgi:predicted ATP-dependent endonuclease of OLD family